MTYEEEERRAKEVFERGHFLTILKTPDQYGEQRPTIIALDKIGSKYIHGVYVFKDPDTGKIETRYWSKILKEGSKILEGQRWDLIDKFKDYETKMYTYRDQKEKARRQADYEASNKAREEVNVKMTQWDTENPEPVNPLKDNFQ